MFKDFDEMAVTCRHTFGLFAKNETGREALEEFSETHGAVPDDILEESGGDVMTFNAAAGNFAFPTERMRAWAVSKLGETLKPHIYTRDLVN